MPEKRFIITCKKLCQIWDSSEKTLKIPETGRKKFSGDNGEVTYCPITLIVGNYTIKSRNLVKCIKEKSIYKIGISEKYKKASMTLSAEMGYYVKAIRLISDFIRTEIHSNPDKYFIKGYKGKIANNMWKIFQPYKTFKMVDDELVDLENPTASISMKYYNKRSKLPKKYAELTDEEKTTVSKSEKTGEWEMITRQSLFDIKEFVKTEVGIEQHSVDWVNESNLHDYFHNSGIVKIMWRFPQLVISSLGLSWRPDLAHVIFKADPPKDTKSVEGILDEDEDVDEWMQTTKNKETNKVAVADASTVAVADTSTVADASTVSAAVANAVAEGTMTELADGENLELPEVDKVSLSNVAEQLDDVQIENLETTD